MAAWGCFRSEGTSVSIWAARLLATGAEPKCMAMRIKEAISTKRFSRMHAIAVVIAVVAGAISISAGQNSVMGQDSPDNKELRGYVLTTDKLTRFENAAKAMNSAMKNTPGLQDKLDQTSQNKNGPNTIAQSAAALDKFPQLTAAIKPFGFSSHEYLVMTFAVANTFAYVEMKKSMANVPMPFSVSAANVAFVNANYDRIKTLTDILGGE